MNEEHTMYREDAEKLARQIQEEDPMMEILDIRLDPEAGGWVVVVFNHETSEEYVLERNSAWSDLSSESAQAGMRDLVVERVKSRHGKKTAHLRGPWEPLAVDAWPASVSADLERGDLPGELLVDVEPSLLEVSHVEPGHADPSSCSLYGNLLVMLRKSGPAVWRRVLKSANFTSQDLSDQVARWKEAGVDLSPEPRAPVVTAGDDPGERGLLDEIRDRLLDISDQGFDAVVVGDNPDEAPEYTWLMAGVMGLKVISARLAFNATGEGLPEVAYRELLHYRTVEEYLRGQAG